MESSFGRDQPQLAVVSHCDLRHPSFELQQEESIGNFFIKE